MIGGRVLDTTAIHDLTVARTVYGPAFLATANAEGIALALPAVALMQAWAAASVHDLPFLELLLDGPLVVVDGLDAPAAAAAGQLGHVAHAGGAWDPAAAHTVMVATTRGWPILTADPRPLRAMSPDIAVELLPDA